MPSHDNAEWDLPKDDEKVTTLFFTYVRSAAPFVLAPSPLFDSVCLAALNTGIPSVGPLPVPLTDSDSTAFRMFDPLSALLRSTQAHRSWIRSL
eukprot:366146-Chlamydomonas_euryale.AAC.3